MPYRVDARALELLGRVTARAGIRSGRMLAAAAASLA